MDASTHIASGQRTHYGVELVVLKNLPAVFLAGTMILGCLILALQLGWPVMEMKDALKAQYSAIGLIFFHWLCMMGTALVCIVVMVMKGPACATEARRLPDCEIPGG